jgi:hypothetical protein
MGRTEVTEELAEYVSGESLAYRLAGSAGPFRVSEGRWVLSPVHNGTLVTVSSLCEPLNALVGIFVGPLAKVVAVRAADRALADLLTALPEPPGALA